MRLFAENPDTLIDQFSSEFMNGYMETLSHRHGTKRILANKVYQEYIADKHHIHMNATIWTSLTELCKYLGKEGKAIVDETEKGWFIQYIDRDPRLLAKQAAADQRKVYELDEEERMKRTIDAQVAAAAKISSIKTIDQDEDSQIPNEFQREEGSSKIEISLIGKKRQTAKSSSSNMMFEDNSSQIIVSSNSITDPSKRQRWEMGASSISLTSSEVKDSHETVVSRERPLSNVELIMKEEEARKLKKQQLIVQNFTKSEGNQPKPIDHHKDNWLYPGIYVKIVNKKLSDGKFYNKKGIIVRVIDFYIGEIQLDDGTVVRIDQEHLETVIPKVSTIASF